MNFSQCMRIMKISMLLLTCFLIQVSASTKAQQISLNKQNSNIHSILQEIRKQAKYDFFYDTDLFKKTESVSIHVNNVSVEQALDAVFKGLPFNYSIDNRLVVITKNNTSTLPSRSINNTNSSKNVRQELGRISGKLVDDRGNVLPDVSVKITQTNQTIRTGIDGTYNMSVAAGNYTIEVSHVSYLTKRITDVQVKAGQLTNLNIVLNTATKGIKQVVVTSNYKKESVAGLFAAQKNAASVTSGISAEQIARTPDNDMGQVLKRVTGLTTVNNRTVVVRGMSDRYNQAMLDGVVIPSTSQNRRDFAFDIIPTEMVSSVVVNKTATPDVSAEFSGGQVSVNTIDVPDQNFISFQFGTGGNTRTTGKTFYRLGERKTSEYFGFYDKSAKLPEGIRTWSWNNRSSQLDAPPGYNLEDADLRETPLNPTELGESVKFNELDAIAQSKRLNSDGMRRFGYKAVPNQNMRLSIGRIYELKNNTRFGFIASANFRNEQNTQPFNNVRNSSSANYLDSTKLGDKGAGTSYKFNSRGGLVLNTGLIGEKFKISFKNMYARTYSDVYNESIQKAYDDSNPSPSKLVYQLPEALELRQHQLTTEYQLPWKIKAEGMFTINNIRQQILDERKLGYGLTTEIGGKAYFQSPYLTSHAQTSNPSSYKEWRLWTFIKETDFNWSGAFSRNFGEGKAISTLIKLGYQAWIKKRTLDLHSLTPWTRASKLGGSPGERAPLIEMSYGELFSEENIGNGNGQAYYYASTIGGRFYDGQISSDAFYLMLDQKFWNKLRLVYGVRAEHFDLNSRQEELYKRSYQQKEIDPEGKMRHRYGVKENSWRFLPSINATYSILQDLNLRGSYSKTVIRPDFREVGMFGMYDFELDGYVHGEHVQSTLIENIDARIEWYPSPEEIISLTAYIKKLDNPIELIHSRDNYYTYANMEYAENKGLELEIRKNFSFISDKEFFKNIFIYANGTLLKSKVNVLTAWEWIHNKELGKAERKQLRFPNQDRPLIGQSPWLLNLGLGYWGDTYGATISYNHRGYRTNLANLDMRFVEYELAPKQLDLQFYGRLLNKRMEAKLNIANILDDWTRFYRNIKDYEQDENKQSILMTGKSIKYNKAEGDIITYRKKDGVRFSLSVSYKF